MNKLKDMLTRNLAWKLLSLFIAIGLWVVVINIENPTESRTYSVMVHLLNESALQENGYMAANADALEDTKVTLRVRGNRMSLERLSQEKNRILATVDLSLALNQLEEAQTVSLPVEIELPNLSGDSIELESKSISYINVELEKIHMETFKIEADIEGSAAEGFVLAEPVVAPSLVNAYGSSEQLARVERVIVRLQVESLLEDVLLSGTPVAVDAVGAEVPEIRLDVSSVEVALSAEPTKEIPVLVDVVGSLPDHLRLREIKVEPSNLWLTGSEEALEEITELRLPAVDLHGITEHVEKTYYLQSLLPEGVQVMDRTQTVAVVTVEPEEAVSGGFTLSADAIVTDIRLADGLEAGYSLESIPVTLKGAPEVMAQLTSHDIAAALVLEADTEGVFDVPLTLILPEGVEAVDSYQMRVQVARRPAE